MAGDDGLFLFVVVSLSKSNVGKSTRLAEASLTAETSEKLSGTNRRDGA